MAWYPGAKKLELQPESNTQAAIRPTQFIMHSIAAPWDEQRMYEYWRDSTNLESHFGLDYDGSLGQFIGTETRADANYNANRRPDGTGAVSIETASNLQHTDAWTPEQIEQLIRLGVWLHQTHGIPLRKCQTADDPGYGYHRMHGDWSLGGTGCPGDARVRQFHDIVFPGIVARANGQNPPSQEEDDMPTVITESVAGGPDLVAGQYRLVHMANDSAIAQGPCSYVVDTYVRVEAAPGTRVTMRFHDLMLAAPNDPAHDLAIDVGTVGPDGVLYAKAGRTGALVANEQLKVEVRASATARVTHRVLRGLRWDA